MYPSDSPAQPVRLGPYREELSADAPLAAGVFPLVVISHGNGGTSLLHRNTAAYLAQNGFVVAMPEHPGNNRSDNTLANTVANLEYRPRHLSLIIDWAYGQSPFAHALKPEAVAIVGHSLGGYTALAVAGGVPTAFAPGNDDRASRRIAVTPDERVKALVLLAPATPWFTAGDALNGVRIPILMFTAQRDEHTPAWHAEIVERGVSAESIVEHRTIANAGHFSFLSPFPPRMATPAFAPAQDPDGFDRARFNAEMNAEILAFLKRVT